MKMASGGGNEGAEGEKKDESTATAIISPSHMYVGIHTFIYAHSAWIYAIRSSLTTQKTIIGTLTAFLLGVE